MSSAVEKATRILEIPEWNPWGILSVCGITVTEDSDDRVVRSAFLSLVKEVSVVDLGVRVLRKLSV
jgi:hypothetical protein